MIEITDNIALADSEVEMSAVRAQGAGGQNVNKVSSAIHLRFDIQQSSLDEDTKRRLLSRRDQRISRDGVLIIKAQTRRTQEQNRSDALNRLVELIRAAAVRPRRRIATKPSRAAQRRRRENKTRVAQKKLLRRPVSVE